MAIRLTDTEKWDRPWFRRLSTEAKLMWIYLCDRCDSSGIWRVDEDAVAFHLGKKIDFEEVAKELSKQFSVSEDDSKWEIKDFSKFQNGHLEREKESSKEREKESPPSPVVSIQGSVDSRGREKEGIRGSGGKGKEEGRGVKIPAWLEPINLSRAIDVEILDPSEVNEKEFVNRLVRFWKDIIGIPKTGRRSESWDRIHKKQHIEWATELLNLCDGDVQVAGNCIVWVYQQLTERGLTCKFSTIVKNTDMFFEKNGVRR